VAAAVVLATRNAHKLREFQRLLPDVELVPLPDEIELPPETGETFEENALIKARAAAAHTGLPALADDSGICVDVLGGSPGVFSAYWAGHAKDASANLNLLLDQLSDVADPHRTAQFVSTIALVVPDNGEREASEHLVEGRWHGRLASVPTGENGFGYDPIFVPDGQPSGTQRSAAEFLPAEKNAASHRARAFAALVPLLSTLSV
jgi:XTP/dITP diphosphohydrolase